MNCWLESRDKYIKVYAFFLLIMIADISIVAITGDLPVALSKITLIGNNGDTIADMFPMKSVCGNHSRLRADFFCKHRVVGRRRLAVKCRINTEHVHTVAVYSTESQSDRKVNLSTVPLDLNDILFYSDVVSKSTSRGAEGFVNIFVERAEPNLNLSNNPTKVLIPIQKTQDLLLRHIEKMKGKRLAKSGDFLTACPLENDMISYVTPLIA